MPPPHIAIIGAGPIGLTLGALLHHASPSLPFTIFERDPSPSSRPSQGGPLDLHSDGGLLAIREAGLWDAFEAVARYEGEDWLICDKRGEPYMQVRSGEEGNAPRPEIGRRELREMLLRAVPEGRVRWGCAVRGLREEEEKKKEGEQGKGSWMLDFEHGEERGGFDLVVGADGAWSKIRPALTPITPQYCGFGGIDFLVRDLASKKGGGSAAAAVAEFVGWGSNFGFGDGKGMFAQNEGGGRFRNACWTLRDEGWMSRCGYDVKDLGEAKKAFLETYGDWREEYRLLIELADEHIVRNLYEMPVGLRWGSRRGITLVGDAAHVMSPCSGEGVNIGMLDCVVLVRKLLEVGDDGDDDDGGQGSLAAKVKEYEEWMFDEADKRKEVAKANGTDMFKMDAPKGLIEGFMARQGLTSGAVE